MSLENERVLGVQPDEDMYAADGLSIVKLDPLGRVLGRWF